MITLSCIQCNAPFKTKKEREPLCHGCRPTENEHPEMDYPMQADNELMHDLQPYLNVYRHESLYIQH